MTKINKQIKDLTSSEYKYGFITDIKEPTESSRTTQLVEEVAVASEVAEVEAEL